jgi:hypothetical protein
MGAFKRFNKRNAVITYDRFRLIGQIGVICINRWSDIEFSNLASLTVALFKSSFLNFHCHSAENDEDNSCLSFRRIVMLSASVKHCRAEGRLGDWSTGVGVGRHMVLSSAFLCRSLARPSDIITLSVCFKSWRYTDRISFQALRRF